MKTFDKYPPRMEWNEFFAMFRGVNEVLSRKAGDILVERRIAELPEGSDFGSSDRWHVIFGGLSYPDYNQDDKTYSLPETPAELEDRIKRFLRDEMIAMDFGEGMIDCFLADPNGFAAFFAPV
mgnify:CR=1 FL=1